MSTDTSTTNSASTGTGTGRVAGLPEQSAIIGEPLAEAAVLGCVLRGGTDQARAVLGLLQQDCWSVPQHAHVAAAARALLARGEPVDPVTVLGQLRRQGLESARTASTDAGVLLVELCQAAPCAGNVGHYARIVLEHAYRRRVQAAALRLAGAAENADLTDLCDLVATELAAVTRAGHRAEHAAGHDAGAFGWSDRRPSPDRTSPDRTSPAPPVR